MSRYRLFDLEFSFEPRDLQPRDIQPRGKADLKSVQAHVVLLFIDVCGSKKKYICLIR